MLTPFTNSSLNPILEAYQTMMICESAEDKNRKRAFQLSDQKLKERGIYGRAVIDQDGNQQFSARTHKPWKYDHEFVDAQIGEIMPNAKNLANAKFMLGVTRILFDDFYNDYENLQSNANTLNKILKLVASPAHVDEYDYNLNGMSFDALKSRFMGAVQKDLDDDKTALATANYSQKNNDYRIIKIRTFEEAEPYGRYTSWCVTHYPDMFRSYTKGGMGVFYFCLKNGFETIKDNVGEDAPFDEYGLSMIAVSVNDDGSLNTCTTRWNHANGGDDNAMDTKELSELLGVNFYDVFKPLTQEEIEQNAYGNLMEAFGLKKDEVTIGEDGSMSFFIPFNMLEDAFGGNGYSYYRDDSLSYDFVKKMLTGDAYDAMNLSYSPEIYFNNLETDAFDKKLKPYGIDFSLIEDIYNDDFDSDNYDISDEQYDLIENLVNDDFCDGFGLYSWYRQCYESGTINEALDDVEKDFFNSFPADKEYGIQYNEKAKTFYIKVNLSKSDIREFGENYDAEGGSISAARALTEEGKGIRIYEPQYGWSGFDEKMWDEGLNDFADKIIDVMSHPPKQQDAAGQQFFEFDKEYKDNPLNKPR